MRAFSEVFHNTNCHANCPHTWKIIISRWDYKRPSHKLWEFLIMLWYGSITFYPFDSFFLQIMWYLPYFRYNFEKSNMNAFQPSNITFYLEILGISGIWFREFGEMLKLRGIVVVEIYFFDEQWQKLYSICKYFVKELDYNPRSENDF